MSSGDDYHSPIVLKVGLGTPLRWLPASVFLLLGSLAISLSQSSLHLKILMTLFLLAGLLWLLISREEAEDARLVINADGWARLQSDKGETREGQLSSWAWLTPWLSVVNLTGLDRKQGLVIAAARQTGDHYRRFRVFQKHRISVG